MLVTPDGRPKVLDLGIAQALPENSALHLELLALEVLPRNFLRDYDTLLQEAPGLYEMFCSAESARHEYCGMLAAGLALANAHLGNFEASDRWMARVDEFLTRRIGPDNPVLAMSYAMLAQRHALSGRAERGLSLAHRAASMLGKRQDIPAKRYAPPRVIVAYAFVYSGRPDLALPHARQSAAVDAAAGHVAQAPSSRVLALALAGVGRRGEALDELERACRSELARPEQLQDRTDLVRAFVHVLADGEDRARYEQWAKELRRLVAAGGFVPEVDAVSRAALETKPR